MLLVEDQPLTLLGIRMSLQELDRFDIVGEATNGVDAIAQQKLVRADVILMDVSMPQMDGIEASWQIKQLFPETKIIIFTSLKTGEVVSAALGAGAEAYLTKDRSVELIAQTIDAVLRGNIWIDPLVADQVVREHHKENEVIPVRFATKELEVLKLIRDGNSLQQIATQLRTSDDAINALMKGLVESFASSTRFADSTVMPEVLPAHHDGMGFVALETSAVEGGIADPANALPLVQTRPTLLLNPAMEIPESGYLFEDKYLMKSVIGQGAGGFVVRAEHIYMGREVAIKVLHHSLLGDKKAMRDFRQEAMSIACLNHDGIIGVYDFGISAVRQPYLVMEYFEGVTLKDILEKEQRLPLPRFCAIFSAICDAMQSAHNHNVIHCDIKPANILMKEIDGEIHIKLADFGLAKILSTDAKIELDSESSVFVSGTPAFMSPEQCRGGELTPLSDIYSLGCVMAESITGEKLFLGNTAVEIMGQHINTVPPTLSQLKPTLTFPPELELLIHTMLQKDPANRIQTLDEVRAVIDSLVPLKIEPQRTFDLGQI